MKGAYNYELTKMRKHLNALWLWVAGAYILSLAFFTLVGKFEATEADTILRTYKGIVTLSLSVTISVITIYMMVVVNRSVVIQYIGNYRERTYAYPGGRSYMLKHKLYACMSLYGLAYMVSICTISTIYYLVVQITRVVETVSAYHFLLHLLGASVLSLLVSTLIILVSMIFGLRHQSIHAGLISSIVLVALIGNLVAHAYRIAPWVLIPANFGLAILHVWCFRIIQKHVEKDDLFKT